ncbi:fumarate lyase [Mycena olivaceomarginata]|nr:fumarate lyase [Mycena olivaceomarginata]
MAPQTGRLSKGMDPLLKKNYQQPGLQGEMRQFHQFCWIDQAHVLMLIKKEIISSDVGGKLLTELKRLERNGVAALDINPDKGSLLFHIEAYLKASVGEDVAGALHTARSRIDQSATAIRTEARDGVLKTIERLVALRRTLLLVADRNTSQAQPGNFAHYLLAFDSRFQDSTDDGTDSFDRINRSPLGTATVGLAGTSVDYLARIAAWLSSILAIANDLATDLHLWSSNEFGFVALDDSLCGTSSIFPQKKNPLALEMIKRAAETTPTFRGEGTGDHMMGVVPIADMLKTTDDKLELLQKVVETLLIKEDRIRDVVDGSWATTNNLADTLVLKEHVSFRQAHHIVAKLCANCVDEKIDKQDVTLSHLQRANDETEWIDIKMSAAELTDALGSERFLLTRKSAGAPSPSEIVKLSTEAREGIKQDEEWLRGAKKGLKKARRVLDEETDPYVAKWLHLLEREA